MSRLAVLNKPDLISPSTSESQVISVEAKDFRSNDQFEEKKEVDAEEHNNNIKHTDYPHKHAHCPSLWRKLVTWILIGILILIFLCAVEKFQKILLVFFVH